MHDDDRESVSVVNCSLAENIQGFDVTDASDLCRIVSTQHKAAVVSP